MPRTPKPPRKQPSRILALTALLLISHLPTPAHATQYTLQHDYTGNGATAFFDAFTFFTSPDPTNGYVQYLSRPAATAATLLGTLPATNTTPAAIYMGVAHAAPAPPPGRPAVRIASTATYTAGTLFVADIAHSPGGVCGTWPALWLLGAAAPWPLAGELDVFEQASLATANAVTAHTGPGCALPLQGQRGRRGGSGRGGYTGMLVTADCNVDAPGQPTNAGCSIDAGPASFGAPFNAAGGGVYAVEWTAGQGFNVWFFPRGAVPRALAAGDGKGTSSGVVDTAGFGTPVARFDGPGCDWESSFRDMQIIINTSLCGDWAGGVWDSGGCAASTGVASCEEYVADNPEAFVDAYWAIAGLRVYRA